MKTIISFLFVCVSFGSLKAQTADSVSTVYELDTMWTPGFTKRDVLKDSLSYLFIRGKYVEVAGQSAMNKFLYKGMISRMVVTPNEFGFSTYSFYMVKRGPFKGSLTMKITETSATVAEIHVYNAFSTFDKKFYAKRTVFEAIKPYVRKPRKPNSK